MPAHKYWRVSNINKRSNPSDREIIVGFINFMNLENIKSNVGKTIFQFSIPAIIAMVLIS